VASKASTAHDDTLTETQALAELVAWAGDRPRWQQDALRRLLANGALQDSDIDELAEICLNAKAKSEPVTAAHIAADGGGEAISLLCIEDPVGINALAPKQKLEFSKDGLTVIYGDNGSGKSGYVRVLKHACRTRDRETAILRDIEDIGGTAQAAKLKFARGAIEMDFYWSPSAAAHPELGAVSIFDSRSASIHVEKTNAVAYIPMPMKVLEELATACDQIKDKLEEQIEALESQTPNALSSPTLSNETAAGAFVHTLSAKSNLAQLTLLSTLSPEEATRLISLEADLAQDPKRAAARVTQQKSRLEQQCLRMKRLFLATSDAAFLERDSLVADRESKKRASKLASDTLFTASPLPKIGEAVWQDLWEAARKYSNEVCYPPSFHRWTVGRRS
jgi:energy-coupling factor transporter ATP-binding protein EcfA2